VSRVQRRVIPIDTTSKGIVYYYDPNILVLGVTLVPNFEFYDVLEYADFHLGNYIEFRSKVDGLDYSMYMEDFFHEFGKMAFDGMVIEGIFRTKKRWRRTAVYYVRAADDDEKEKVYPT